MVAPRFTRGERLTAAKLNELGALVDATLAALRSRDARALLQLGATLAARIRVCGVKVVHTSVASYTDRAAVIDPDAPDSVTYTIAPWGTDEEFAQLRPAYNRAATGADVLIHPARVDDWCILFRGIVDAEDSGQLWILTEELARVECTPPSEAQRQDALLELVRLIADVGVREGLLGPPIIQAGGESIDLAGVAIATPEANPPPGPAENSVQTDLAILDLNAATVEHVVDLPANVRGVLVAAVPDVPSAAAWTRTLNVQIRVPTQGEPSHADLAFGTPKSITAAAAGAMVQLDETDLPGVRTIVIKASGATPEAARLRLAVSVTVA